MTVAYSVPKYEPEDTMVSRFTGIFKRGSKTDDDCDDPECKEVRELSSEYIDGELDQDAQEKITSHIGWCVPCNAFVNTLRATVDLLRGMPRRQASSDLRKRIRDNMPKESPTGDN